MTKNKITVLVEDRSSRPELRAEHGIALLLEVGEERWLFDTGQSRLVDDDEGVIMITGCCHAGLINSLKEVRELHLRKRIKAIVGGLHLRAADQTKVSKIIRSLKSFTTEEIIAGHCTGTNAEAAFSRAFGSRFRKMKTGSIFEF